LLQLARGAGVKGLAGMPIASDKLLRPFLDTPRSCLEDYAEQHRLTWIEDESNFDTKYDRNFLRHEIIPKLEKQYPAIKQTISRAARHMAEADILLDELAELDVRSRLLNQNDSKQIALKPLAVLNPARVNNALRWWLLQNGCDVPSTAQLQQITQQLLYAKNDANIKINVSANLTLRRFQGRAYLVKNVQKAMTSYQRSTFSLPWQGEPAIILPDQSRLLFSEKIGAGMAKRHIEKAQLLIRYREGGETIKAAENRPSRSLKSIFQTFSIPPWQRERLPLLYINSDLVMLPNIVVDARFKAAVDEPGLVVNWQDN
jgi:tRNA(Ile)-lysidine synthase